MGRECPCRGVINSTGRWYCREHWLASQGVVTEGHGNYPVKSPRSQVMHQWDGWYETWLARRDRKRMPMPVMEREPGCDDEPMLADQA